jgi:hypothetical protein
MSEPEILRWFKCKFGVCDYCGAELNAASFTH